MRNFQMLAGFILLVLSMHASQAREILVRVTDKNGEALPQVVVSTEHPAASEASATAVMDQVDRLFAPFILAIRPGMAVDFPNSDNIRHQVYSFSATRPFELPLYSNRNAPTITFPEAGIVVLGCNIHDHMRAYLYVSPHLQSLTTNAQGEVTLEVAEGATELFFWYPSLGDSTTAEHNLTIAADQKVVDYQLAVAQQQQMPPPPSPLQERFNRLKNNVN
ncbi:hypothetical protein PSI9734_00204 [Pseudidiomarina piscicola]|uniref:Methylamine utilization protein n=1 Tax=Pseudidiomarina piscicola TaxID=2614830 RepID=A0A6S6WLK0_9GAMM|nr:methylamine utilization protein [Pseudidiomarina piscicola]CAB0149628.1 hypothetical protein PSI9734_00204 [Pseudidiomarina piscicola]VZT39076.1 hypothetical protein PSI9734_00204 [Pseudomonas aeruginosa]